MSSRLRCVTSVVRAAAPASERYVVHRYAVRRVASSATVPGKRRTAFTRTSALAGIGVTVAALSLLALTVADPLSDTVEAADDDGPLADGLSHAPQPAPLGSPTHSRAKEADVGAADHPAAVTAAAAGANQPSSILSPSGKPHLVILGSGWGAVSLLKGLDRDAYEVTVISPRNYFLFTPLLPSATTGQVESRTLMEPIRRICQRIRAHYFEGKVRPTPTAHRTQHTAEETAETARDRRAARCGYCSASPFDSASTHRALRRGTQRC